MTKADLARARYRAFGRVLAVGLVLFVASAIQAQPGRAGEPDYSEWDRLLAKYHSTQGFDYAGLKLHESQTLRDLRDVLAMVNVEALDPDEELAYWINLYNVNIVGLIVDNYPIDSIRDLSTDLFIRLNVFKKPHVPFAGDAISLDYIEHEKIRPRFRDGRIHFAVNCGAKSCPPVRGEAYVGARLDEQLDDQVRRFAAGSGLRIENDGGDVVVHTTKIMDWYGDDFEDWHGGVVQFLLPYMPESKRSKLKGTSRVKIRFDDYDWSLNDWRR